MTTAQLRGLAAVTVFCTAFCTAAAPVAAQARFIGADTPSGRQAVDRRVDESARQTQTARQTEAPKESPVRQPDPPRQRQPERQIADQRHAAPANRGNNSGHWQDPGPAWRPVGPAWSDLNDRPGTNRPGVDAFRPGTQSNPKSDRGGRRDSRRDDSRHKGGNGYYGYPYVAPFAFAPYYPYYSTVDFEPEPPREPAPAAVEGPPLGFLQLRVLPRNADVFVDGGLAGTVDDFGGRGARMLPAGPHRVEISLPGFESVTFDVRVPENDTVTFTRDLDRVGDRPIPEPIVVPHKAMYVVPMCYIGDRPPLLSDMPAGCRVEDVRVIP